MFKKNVLLYPDVRLRMIAEPVQIIDGNTRKIINHMFNVMYKKNGIGLAATQINIQKRIIVTDISSVGAKKLVFINPIILKAYGEISIEESCLSIPGRSAYISRSKYIQISAFESKGKKIKLKASNLLSICIQHEVDHLNGKLFIDYISKIY
ncbi:hypothetical protein AOQ88_01545 [Candidatus Riesia sp. GBBU]|nr:hypothetical protein AOQ88_01545 [Candidatus Riesia sp. GBBU]